MNLTKMLYSSKEKSKGDNVGLFCYVCGDETELVRFVGGVVCRDCAKIQTDVL